MPLTDNPRASSLNSNRKDQKTDMKFGVVVFPGSNCDHDTYHVISKVIGQPVDFIWHRQSTLGDADADWHPQVPLPSLAGYELTPRSNVIRTPMDVGPARVRRRSTVAGADLKARIDGALWQQMLFESWQRWLAEEGGAWFNVPLLFPYSADVITVRARIKAAQSSVIMHPTNGQRWQVTLQLEVPRRPMLERPSRMAPNETTPVST